MQTVINSIASEVIANSMDYSTYRTMIDELFANNKTTGNNHNETMLHYTKMNIQRMKRLDKKVTLTEDAIAIMSSINRPMVWLTITEGWCADAAQILPVIQKFTDLNEHVEHRFILRDENLDVMDKFLTNNARSIPITIFLDANNYEILGTWGPKPEIAQNMLMDAKQDPDTDWTEFKTNLQRWYNKDKTLSTQEELIRELESLKS